MLFIDEAYLLERSSAVNGDLVGRIDGSGAGVMLVAAGYKDGVNRWLDNNAGLEGRITLVDMPDYTTAELIQIGENVLAGQGCRLKDEDAGAALARAADFVATQEKPWNARGIKERLLFKALKIRDARFLSDNVTDLTGTDIDTALGRLKHELEMRRPTLPPPQQQPPPPDAIAPSPDASMTSASETVMQTQLPMTIPSTSATAGVVVQAVVTSAGSLVNVLGRDAGSRQCQPDVRYHGYKCPLGCGRTCWVPVAPQGRKKGGMRPMTHAEAKSSSLSTHKRRSCPMANAKR